MNNSMEKFISFFQFAHKFIENEAKLFREEFNRHFYVTPATYLGVIKKFKEILLKKQKENQ